ncbi:MAG: ComF family protein [Candidatus Dormibacteraeota bacterium]|nr:ComF family protein [Candidatus Dormibacteraeota bacterium]
MLETLLDLLLPPRCGGCGRLGSLYCESCRRRTRHLEEPICGRCGAEVEHARSSCGCQARIPCLTRLRSAAAYEGPLEKAIHRFKYEGRRPLARPLALLLAERLAMDGIAGEVITWVPLHKQRHRRRGYNQAELLARELARLCGLPTLAGLVRLRDTPAQVGLDRLRRQANMAGAFGWEGKKLARRSLLLIDDVATTGATLEACAGALKAAGAGAVIGFTVARVKL